MTKYSISNQTSGCFQGIYEASSPSEAINVMARDAGYKDHAHVCEVLGITIEEGEADLVVVEVDEAQ